MNSRAISQEYKVKELITKDDIYNFVSSETYFNFLQNAENPRSIWAAPWYLRATINDNSRVVQFFDSESLVAIFPYSLDKKFGIRCIKAHRFDLFPEKVDLIVLTNSNRETLSTTFQNWLSQQQVIDVNGVENDSILFQVLDNLNAKISETSSSRTISKFTTLSELLQSTSRNFRSSITRSLKKLDELEVTFEMKDPTPEVILKFLKLHEEQFGKTSEISKQLDTYENIFVEAMKEKSMKMMIATTPDDITAIDIWFNIDTDFYLINTGRKQNREFKNLGNLIMINGIISAFDLGATRVDLMSPDYDYKKKMGGKAVMLYRLRCAKTRFWWKMYRLSRELSKVINGGTNGFRSKTHS